MSNDSDKSKTTAPKAPTLYLIAGFKLLKGLIVLLLAAGIFALSGHNLGDVFDNVLRWVHLDPEKRFFAAIGDQLDTYTPANLKATSEIAPNKIMAHPKIGLTLVLIVNVIIVWYLFRNRNRLFRHHH